jgi:hypothetical protein
MQARERVASRIARARVGIVAGVAAVTCGLALFIQSIAPGSSTASTHRSSAGGSSTADSGGGFDGGGWSGITGASAPSASAGGGDTVSGGS